MKAIEVAPESVPTQSDDVKVGSEIRRVQSGRDILVFKGISLEELLKKAAGLQSLIALLRPWDMYELEATYDITDNEWIGQLCELA